MENSKLITILTEVDEGTKTPFKAHNEILSLFGVVQQREQLIAFMDDLKQHPRLIILPTETIIDGYMKSNGIKTTKL